MKVTDTCAGFDKFPVDKFFEALSEILSEKYDAKITMKATKKEHERKVLKGA